MIQAKFKAIGINKMKKAEKAAEAAVAVDDNQNGNGETGG
jgi:hypothetical protein